MGTTPPAQLSARRMHMGALPYADGPNGIIMTEGCDSQEMFVVIEVRVPRTLPRTLLPACPAAGPAADLRTLVHPAAPALAYQSVRAHPPRLTCPALSPGRAAVLPAATSVHEQPGAYNYEYAPAWAPRNDMASDVGSGV
jgi:hypothetical protein